MTVLSSKKYQDCLDFIGDYWNRLTCFLPQNKGANAKLPLPFVSPNNERFRNSQFYWDSYFIILGLTASGKIDLARGMVDNLVYLFKKFKIIPFRNIVDKKEFYSQPPFLTSMILEVFKATRDYCWLEEAAKTAEDELNLFWKKEGTHLICRGLSRYFDPSRTHYLAEFESGWDLTSRFQDHCLDYLPVDLNSCLYRYEKDLGRICGFLEDTMGAERYWRAAEKRKDEIVRLMWNEEAGFFFDYNFKTGKISDFYSLAGFYPLWAGLASVKQAERMKKNLDKFEYEGGLANTQSEGLSRKFRQWDYPNGWANQQWIVVRGLADYGFKSEAERLVKKWLDMNQKVFEKTGKFWEKYNVVDRTVGREGLYPNQSGFGWTNAVFVKLVAEFGL